MNATDFLPFLGKPSHSDEIQQLLKALGAKSAPKIKRGDTAAYVTLATQGFSLVFGATEDPKSSLLLLNEVQLYGGTEGGEVTPYTGALPFGLAFSDSRKETRKKLGKPAYADNDLDSDYWDYPDHSFGIDYHGKATRIGVIHLQSLSGDEDE